MIAPKIVAEVRRLLTEGVFSHREIARLTGISRGSVGAIATGKRPDYEPPQQEDALEEPSGPPERCAGCGGRVYTPCVLCCVRKRIAKNRRSARQGRAVSSVESHLLNLRPEHRARYEEVRAWRRENRGQPIEGLSTP